MSAKNMISFAGKSAAGFAKKNPAVTTGIGGGAALLGGLMLHWPMMAGAGAIALGGLWLWNRSKRNSRY